MRSPSRRAVTVAAIATAVTATLAGAGLSQWIAFSDHGSILDTGVTAAVVVSFAVVGAVVAGARPSNIVGWLMLAAAASWALGDAGIDVAHHGIVTAPGSVAGVAVAAIGGSAARAVGWYLISLVVPAYFPDGRLAKPRWRWLRWMLLVIVLASAVEPILDKQADLEGLGGWRNPIAPNGWWQAISGLAFLGHVPLSLVAAIAIIVGLRVRWRRGNAVERQQLLLLFTAVIPPIIAVPVGIWVPGAGDWIFGAAVVPLPFAIGFAVLARGLYDLRTAANRTLVWVTLSAVIATLYAVVIAGLGSRVNDRDATWLAWVAAAVVAVSFAPLRDLLQRGINRLTFGRWDEPYDVLAGLGQRLEATADVDRLLTDVVDELHGLGLADVTINGPHGQLIAGHADAHTGRIEQPLSAFNQLVGTLRYRLPASPLRTRDRRLLDDLAGHLGGVLHTHQLTLDLQQALERQVLAREEERRRLRRDLHDGLGPALAGHLLRLDLIATKVDGNSAASREVNELREELRQTVTEVRRVVEGLRPPALDELGLPAAIGQVLRRLTAGTPVEVELRIETLPALSAATEVAAYRIVTEAVTNVVRHAGATRCQVRVVASNGLLHLVIADDGCGLDPIHSLATAGNGLATMRERAEELRGRLHIVGGQGTTVVAELPLLARTGSAGNVPAQAAGV
jgi:signal transduction histidine kinase